MDGCSSSATGRGPCPPYLFVTPWPQLRVNISPSLGEPTPAGHMPGGGGGRGHGGSGGGSDRGHSCDCLLRGSLGHESTTGKPLGNRRRRNGDVVGWLERHRRVARRLLQRKHVGRLGQKGARQRRGGSVMMKRVPARGSCRQRWRRRRKVGHVHLARLCRLRRAPLPEARAGVALVARRACEAALCPVALGEPDLLEPFARRARRVDAANARSDQRWAWRCHCPCAVVEESCRG